MRERWFGATGLKVPEIAVEGEELTLVDRDHVRHEADGAVYEALVAEDVSDPERLVEAHAAGLPVVVRAADARAVEAALARPEVACALVPGSAAELRQLDLRRLRYG